MLKIVRKWVNQDSQFIIGIAAIHVLLAGIAFIKDVLIASYLGTTIAADAFALAFFIPDTIGNNWLASAVGVACIPIFTSLHPTGDINVNYNQNFQSYFNKICSHVVTISFLLCLLLYVCSGIMISILDEGLSKSGTGLSLQLLWILIPISLFFPLVMVGSAALQVAGSFFVPALAPVLFNIVFLLCAFGAYLYELNSVTGTYLISIGILIGSFAIAFYVYRELYLKGMRPNFKLPSIKERQPQIKSFYSLLFPYLAILFFLQLVYFVERYFASKLGEGTISGLTYAFRLAQFPNWVFIAAISVVMLPAFTRACHSKDYWDFRKLFIRAIGMSLIITVPCALLLSFGAEQIIGVLFMRGAFNEGSLAITSGILEGYAWAIVGQSISVVGIRYWLAVGKLRFSVLAGLISAVITVLYNVHFIDLQGPSTIGWGAAMGSAGNAILLCSAILIDLNIRKKLWAGKENED